MHAIASVMIDSVGGEHPLLHEMCGTSGSERVPPVWICRD